MMDSPKATEESPNVERYSCSRCKFHTTSKRQLQHHIRQRHSPGKYVCQECGEKFNRALMYKLHITTHTNKGDHACPTCNKTFPLVSMLKIHQETHSSESIHPCPHCSKQFRQKSALSKHVAFGHTKKNVHPCTICGKILPSPSALVLHMDAHKSSTEKTAIDGSAILSRRLRFYHRPNDQNMFRCQRCNRKFFTSYALAKHMEGHHGMQTHKCIQCNMDFKTKKALYRHTAEHVHECDECGKKFRSQEQLDTHKKLHSKCELVCVQCGRHFSKGSSYRRHMESHAHNPKYQCPECGKNFRRQADLNMHQELHKGDGFPCEDCGKAFGTKQHLIWHSYIHYSAKMAVKQEKSESDVTADVTPEETTEPEMKKEPVSASECGTPKKQTKKEVGKKSKSASKKDNQEEKEKRKEKTRTPSPAKKSGSGSSVKTPNSKEGAKKKTGANDKIPHVEREVKIKEEKVEESRSKSATATPSKAGNATPSKSGNAKPSKSENATTSKSGKATPLKSESHTPSKSGKATPLKSGNATPSKSGNVTPSKSGNATKSTRSTKKSRRRRSKGKRKSQKSNSTGSGEPTPTDTDSKGVTETESATDTQSEKQPSEKMLSTEEALLSDDVLQDSNELHDAKELQVDHVMFDDNEDDVELDINAAIETLTKLGSHTENEVTTEAFDEVGIDEDLDQQTVKDITVEDDIVGLEDIGNIEAADKEIGNVDIQTLYDMETDNEAGTEAEAATAKAAAGVLCAMQDNNTADLEAVTDAEQVMSDSSAAMLIESEIVKQADRLIETGLYVQNVMGAQDCNTVLEALNTAVQNEALNVGQGMMESQQGEKDELASSNLIQSLIENMNASDVQMAMVPAGTAEQANEIIAAASTESNSTMLQEAATLEEAPNPVLTVQEVAGEKSDTMDQSDEIKSISNLEKPTEHSDVSKSTDDKSPVSENKGGVNDNSKDDQQQNECRSSKEASGCQENNADPCANGTQIENVDAPKRPPKSTSYAAAFEMFIQNSDAADSLVPPCDTPPSVPVAADSEAECAPCPHIDNNGQVLDAHSQCVGGCAKCSTEFGLSINKTVCPHSKELKVVIEKLDIKDCPVSDKGEVMMTVGQAVEPTPAPKRKRAASTELESLLGGKDLSDVLPEASPNKAMVGMSRLRRRIRHSSGDSRSVSTKICETRRRESQPSIEPLVTSPEQGSVSPRVSTRSHNARVPRPIRTGQPNKEWRKPSPPTEKKHTKKFTSVPRRKSDSDQMSPPPQYKVSTLNDLTIRITTQSSPETSPSQQKKSPSSKDGSFKGSKTIEKEDSLLRQTHGATQELCVVLDDINELVLLQQERLQKLKGFRPVKLGKKAEEKKRHKSSEIPSEMDVPQKPIKILLRLPKDRIKKHERRLAALDRRMSHGSPDAEPNSTREYPQPDSSQDMHRDKSRYKLHDGVTGHRQRGNRTNDAVIMNNKDTASSAGSPEQLPIEEWQGEGSESCRVIGSMISLNSSVLSVEECDSTSMAETQRQASSAISSPDSEKSKRKSGSRRKEASPNKGGSPSGQSHMILEPLDLTVKYKELSDTEVKPDPDQADDSMEGADYCACDDDMQGHASDHSSSSAIKTEDDHEDSSPSAGASTGSCAESTPNDHGSSCDLTLRDDAPQAASLNCVTAHIDDPEANDFVSEEGADGPVTEFIEVIDRGIQCELGDELLFMPEVPQQAVD